MIFCYKLKSDEMDGEIMKILIAPDSFKGSLEAVEVTKYIEKGIKNILPDCETVKVPMADGGEGTVHSLVTATDGEIFQEKVFGPLGEEVEAYYGILGDGKTGVIEMAAASGLPLISDDKADPSKTTTFGTGELIKYVLDKDVDKIIIGIGGSATNDAGVGMAQALGIQFINDKGEEVGFGGKELKNIKKIDMSGLDSRINETEIEVACDVNNPLYGPKGAAHVYAPQKGADQKMVVELDKNLRHFSKIVKNDLNQDVQSIPGAGAAGGLGAGLVAFLNAELRSGIEIILEANKIEEKLQDVDLVFTGEGEIDGQTINGKTPVGVARKAAKFKIPVIALGGATGEGVEKVLNEDIDAVFSVIQKPLSLEEVFDSTGKWLEFTVEQVMRLLNIKL